MAHQPVHRVLFILLLTWVAPSALADYPAPLGNHINDYADILDDEVEQFNNVVLSNLERDTGVEMQVVIINTFDTYNTEAVTIEPFATGLFNHWGIGDKTRNDGILLLAAINDRAIRIELGAGYPVAADATVQGIIDRNILPHFRESDYSSGIREGTAAVVAAVRTKTLLTRAARAERDSAVKDSVRTEALKSSPPAKSPSPARKGISYWFNYAFGRMGYLITGIAVVIIGFTFMVALYVTGRGYFERHKARNCPKCGLAMQRLDETADDSFLDAGQKLEEQLESVDYDIWLCPGCKTSVRLPYKAFFTSYNHCPQCNRRTLKEQEQVQTPATYSATGVMLVIGDCRHCGHHRERTEVIPVITRSHSRSGRSVRIGRSGRSARGGRSSGRGGSGRW